MSATDRTYRVNEIFNSLQGEGYHTGRPAVFVRLSGCNRCCDFCDTDHSNFSELTAAEIVAESSRFASRFMVITGGEPLLQVDAPLIDAIHRAGFTIAVETNGSLPAPAGIDWITCSPKEKPWLLERCDELKVVFTSPEAPPEASMHFDTPNRFVQPLFDNGSSTSNTDETIQWLLRHPDWRLSLQTHKLLNIR